VTDKWFYSKNNEKLGPVTLDEIKDLINKSDLSNNSLIWQVGTQDWVELHSIINLTHKPILNSEPPPLPPKDHMNCQPLPKSNQKQDSSTEKEKNSLNSKQITDYLLILLAIIAAIVSICNPSMASLIFYLAIISGIRYWFFRSRNLTGLWIPRSDSDIWVEIKENNQFVFEDGRKGEIKKCINDSFIEFTSDLQGIKLWKIVKFKSVIGGTFKYISIKQDCTTNIDYYQYHDSNVNPRDSDVKKVLANLSQTWIYRENNKQWISITKDMAISYSNGKAGSIACRGIWYENFNDCPPCKIISVKLTDGTISNYRLISVTKNQLILSQNGKPLVYLSNGLKAESNSKQNGPPENTLADSVDEKQLDDTNNVIGRDSELPVPIQSKSESEITQGNDWDTNNNSWFNYLFSKKRVCPNCKRRSCNETKRYKHGDTERVLVTKYRHRFEGDKHPVPYQIYVDRWLVRGHFLCEACRNEHFVDFVDESIPR
jgi:hypothetical protein